MNQKITLPGKARKLRNLASRLICASACASVLYTLPVAVPLQSALFSGAAYAAEEEDGRRPPPEARQSETLSRRVYQRIEEVMELRDVEDYTGAEAILDEIHEMFQAGRLNNRETQVMFQFYADIARSQERLDDALNYTRQILNIENLSQEMQEQSWEQVGHYNFALERYEDAIEAYKTYISIAIEPKPDIYLRLAYAYYSLERYVDALDPLLTNMRLVRERGEQVPENTYGVLRSIYVFEEDYPNAYQAYRETVTLFGKPRDWITLAQLAAQLDKFNERAQLYWVGGVGGFIDREGDLVTLAQLLMNNDYPFGCAEIMVKGMADGQIEANDLDNQELTSRCYQMAREDALAVPYQERAAEMSDDGENYASLALIYMRLDRFEEAVDAFEKAFEKGDVNRADQKYLFLTRALLELNRFDDAKDAARKASRDERSEDQARSWIATLDNEKRKYEENQKARVELREYFR